MGRSLTQKKKTPPLSIFSLSISFWLNKTKESQNGGSGIVSKVRCKGCQKETLNFAPRAMKSA